MFSMYTHMYLRCICCELDRAHSLYMFYSNLGTILNGNERIRMIENEYFKKCTLVFEGKCINWSLTMSVMFSWDWIDNLYIYIYEWEHRTGTFAPCLKEGNLKF